MSALNMLNNKFAGWVCVDPCVFRANLSNCIKIPTKRLHNSLRLSKGTSKADWKGEILRAITKSVGENEIIHLIFMIQKDLEGKVINTFI